MGNEEFVKKVYLSSVEGTNRRGRPLVRWEDRVREYVNEMGVRGNVLDWARRECMDRERWKYVCRGHSLGGHSGGGGIRAIDSLSILLPTLNIWIGELDMEYTRAVESTCCRDELPVRSVWSE